MSFSASAILFTVFQLQIYALISIAQIKEVLFSHDLLNPKSVPKTTKHGNKKGLLGNPTILFIVYQYIKLLVLDIFSFRNTGLSLRS